MRLACHTIIEGPCITQGATAWGENVMEFAELKARISQGCAKVRKPELSDHRLTVRIDFHLNGRRLKLTDLDNMAKVVLDAAFSHGENMQTDRMADRRVWRMELCKINNPLTEFTEIWFFDEGVIE